jgi:hypothetical protein
MGLDAAAICEFSGPSPWLLLSKSTTRGSFGQGLIKLLQRMLRDFRSAFATLTDPEESEALQCVLKSVTVYPLQLDLEIFELQEFLPGSQNRKEWLPGLDSN